MKLYALVRDNADIADDSIFLMDSKLYTEEEKKIKENEITEEFRKKLQEKLKNVKEIFEELEAEGYKEGDIIKKDSEFWEIFKRTETGLHIFEKYVIDFKEYEREMLQCEIQKLEREVNSELSMALVPELYWEELEVDIEKLQEQIKIEEREARIRNEIIEKLKQTLKQTKTVVTHFGDDLDNKSSIYAIEKYARENGILEQDEKLQITRVPAGQVKQGMLNVDTGGHKGNRNEEDGTIVIDGDPANGVQSAAQSLANLGINIPFQILALADTIPNEVSALDSRRGLALVRYLSGEQLFSLAEDGLLSEPLTDKQLEEFGLTEAHKKQQQVIDNAVEKIQQYTVELPSGEQIVLAPEQIIGGSAIAYEMGIPYYASASNHFDKDRVQDGVTFAITSEPGTKLPKEVLQYGQELVEEYRIDERSSGVFVNPNGQMIVAGGFKNPEFKIPDETVLGMLNKIKEKFIGQELEKESFQEK